MVRMVTTLTLGELRSFRFQVGERETGELRDSRMETNDGISRLHSADRPIVLHGLLEQALKDLGDKFFLAFPIIFHQQPIAVW